MKKASKPVAAAAAAVKTTTAAAASASKVIVEEEVIEPIVEAVKPVETIKAKEVVEEKVSEVKEEAEDIETDAVPFNSAADLVQSIYLNALRDYKPAAEKASDSEGQVKKWSAPAAPKAPEASDAAFVSSLAEYESSIVEVEGQEAGADGEIVAAKHEDWFDESVLEDGDAKHH